MRAALLSKDYGDRAKFVADFLEESGRAIAIYLYPKNRKKELIKPQTSTSVHYFTYEDMTKTDEWLQIHSLLGDNTALVLDNPSRYPKITSTKVLALERLEKMVNAKVLVDIVPFTLDVQYLFQPVGYLGRDLLGYAHYYAWRENYCEVDPQGRVKAAHDFELVAEKLREVYQIRYPQFLCPNRTVVRFCSTAEEQERYAAVRDDLFAAEEFSPQPVITKLADLAHAFQSRYDALLDLLSQLSGTTLLYTNLSDYAKKAVAIAKRDGFTKVKGTSYQVGSTERFDNVVYLESPIVKSYFLLDAESRLADNCQVFHLVGDAKVEQYLWGQLEHELTQINGFTQELYRVVHRREAVAQTVPPENRAPGGAGAYQMALF